jgi:hypothetical protein
VDKPELLNFVIEQLRAIASNLGFLAETLEKAAREKSMGMPPKDKTHG